MGVSTVKWKVLEPCPILSESDSVLYINFELCKEQIHILFKNLPIYKAKQLMTIKWKLKKRLHILDDGASGVQVGDIQQVMV